MRNLGWIRANLAGIALYTAMESVVLAVGRIVVCVEAAAEVSTMNSSRWVRKLPKPDEPKIEPPEDREDVALVVRVAKPDAFLSRGRRTTAPPGLRPRRSPKG